MEPTTHTGILGAYKINDMHQFKLAWLMLLMAALVLILQQRAALEATQVACIIRPLWVGLL